LSVDVTKLIQEEVKRHFSREQIKAIIRHEMEEILWRAVYDGLDTAITTALRKLYGERIKKMAHDAFRKTIEERLPKVAKEFLEREWDWDSKQTLRERVRKTLQEVDVEGFVKRKFEELKPEIEKEIKTISQKHLNELVRVQFEWLVRTINDLQERVLRVESMMPTGRRDM